MDTRNPAENKRIVLEGLKRRNDRMDAYEQAMITACNKNCADAKKRRAQEEVRHTAQVVSEEDRKARAQERLHAMQETHRQEQEATRAVNCYLFVLVTLLLLAAATQFPYWAAIATALSLSVFLCGYLYRVFVPLESDRKR